MLVKFESGLHGVMSVNVTRQLLPGQAQSTHLLHWPMSRVGLDFVEPFPKVSGYDILLSCSFRLTGFVCLIPTNQKYLAEKTEQRLRNPLLLIFGALNNVVGD